MLLQLALALLLAEDLLPGLAQPPELYDPTFSEVDRLLLGKRLGMVVLERDERCARTAARPTLFYLPHLEVSRVGVRGLCGGSEGSGQPSLIPL